MKLKDYIARVLEQVSSIYLERALGVNVEEIEFDINLDGDCRVVSYTDTANHIRFTIKL